MTDHLRILVVGIAGAATEAVISALRGAGIGVEVRVEGDPETVAGTAFVPDLVVSEGGSPTRIADTETPDAHGGDASGPAPYRDIIEYSRDLFYVHTPDHVLTYVSPQSREFFDCDPEQALVRWTEFATDHPSNRAGFEATERAIATGERQPVFELELKSTTGRRFWVEVREAPVVKDGRTVAIVGALTDISGRKTAKKRVTLLAHALRSVGEGVCMTDEADRIQFVNDAFCRLYGYTPAEVVGRHIGMLRAENVPVTLDAIREGTLEEGWQGEIWNVRKDGTRMLVSLSTSTVRDENGKPLALVGVMRDVTDLRRAIEALRESEDRYRDLVEHSTDLICTHDLDGVFLTLNEAAAQAVGYTIDELVGHNLAEFLSPRGREVLPAYLTELARKGSARGIMELVARGGDLRYWEYDNSVRTEGVAEPVVRGRARDVTERLLTEHSLRTSERRYRALFEGANDGVLILRNSRFTECNPKACEIYGRTLEELVGMAPWEVSPPTQPDGETSRAKAQRVMAAVLAGVPQRVEWEHTRGDGSRFFVEVSLNALPMGQETLVQAVVRDVTLRRQAAEAEKRRLRQLAAVNRMTRQVASELDPDTVVRAAVREVHDIFGYHNVMLLQVDPEAQDLGRQAIAGAYESVAGADYRQKIGEGLIGEAAATGRTVLCDDVRNDPRFIMGFDVEVATRSEVAVPIHAGGDVIAVLDVQEVEPGAFDVSDIHVLETLASEIGTSLNNARLYAAHKATEEQLRQAQKMEAVGRLAGGVAHDFNNLLQAMLATVQVMRHRSEGLSEIDLQLAELEDGVRRGAALTRQLLLFARREVATRETLDLRQVLGDALPMLRRLIPETIRLATEMGSDALPVVGDQGQLQQVLVNLVVNAVDAMPHGGSLLVRAGRSSDGPWWDVTDSGVGMSDDVQRRLFEPFFTTKKLGTGLGLAVAHGIVTTHGGSIEVTSTVGEGSRVRITLPAASDDAEVLGARPVAGGFDAGHGERVLVVEDEPAAREGLTDILDMIGYAVESVESAEAALALESPTPFDVLLTDFVLPGRNGLELAAILTQAQPELGVILMSGYAEDTASNGGTLPEHVRYLQKPFDARTLARMLRDVLEGA